MNRSIRLYSEYFGMRENAFAITPDPRYLFMSDRHREALAHLLFGTEEGGGFVQLTGEVGTGKTTICRAFLEQLPENVDVALLLNPPESGRELLLAIATELRLPVANREAQVRELVDRLNVRLLEAHAAGRRTVVIIDEAQNIRNEVLEQVRLLTNLETPTHKLLQVFLIGQPELRQKLESPGLRQVAQRITARYHLEPLSLLETRGYIRHRLAVAGCRQGLFTPSAIRQIYRQSQGIPRVINILCDRALLGAFATDSAEVTSGIVRYAAREWRGETHGRSRLRRLARPALAAGMAGLMLAAAAGFAGNGTVQQGNGIAALARDGMQGIADLLRRLEPGIAEPPGEGVAPALRQGRASTEPVPGAGPPPGNPAAAASAPSPAPVAPAIPAAREFPELVQFAAAVGPETVSVQRVVEAGAPVALQALLARWGIERRPADRLALCDAALAHGLHCLRERAGWNELIGYNRPALLTLVTDAGVEASIALVGMSGENAVVATADGERQVPVRALEAYWSGEFVMLWRPPLGGVAMIAAGSTPRAVAWLQRALARVDGQGDGGMGFDQALERRLRSFQKRRGLQADGIAGPRTLIHLTTLTGERDFPLLVAAQGNGG
ncbi:MAG TPA: AAA family ATPase [Gammaproteobacteria bacterium]|jgi:general secretion pathway protein A